MAGDIYANMLNQLAFEAHTNAVKHGFYSDIDELTESLYESDKPHMNYVANRDFILAQLAKIASEVGEAVAVIQHDPNYKGLNEELADITIRTMDLASFLSYNHGNDVIAKMEKNKNRPIKHGKLC